MDDSIANLDTPAHLIEAIVDWKMNLFRGYHLLQGAREPELDQLCVANEEKLRAELQNLSFEELQKKLKGCEFERQILAI